MNQHSVNTNPFENHKKKTVQIWHAILFKKMLLFSLLLFRLRGIKVLWEEKRNAKRDGLCGWMDGWRLDLRSENELTRTG